MLNKPIKCLVIIPAFNEGKCIDSIINNLKTKAPSVDIVVINDGSVDDTLEKALSTNVVVIDLPFNLGIGGAMQTGYQYAMHHNYDIAIQFDGDGQHNPEYIDTIIEPIIKGTCNMVIGSRYLQKTAYKSDMARRFGMVILSGIISASIKQKITDTTSGFRAADRGVINFFADTYPHDYPEPDVLVRLYKNNFKMCEVSVEMNERSHGKSSITPFLSIYYIIKVTLASLISTIRIYPKIKGAERK